MLPRQLQPRAGAEAHAAVGVQPTSSKKTRAQCPQNFEFTVRVVTRFGIVFRSILGAFWRGYPPRVPLGTPGETADDVSSISSDSWVAFGRPWATFWHLFRSLRVVFFVLFSGCPSHGVFIDLGSILGGILTTLGGHFGDRSKL